MHLQHTYYIFDGVFYLKLQGDFIGLSQEKKILSLIDTYLSQSFRKFVVDLSKINHINSAGLSYLVRMLNRVRKQKGLLVLKEPSKQVVKLLEITKLLALCTLANSKKEVYKILDRAK